MLKATCTILGTQNNMTYALSIETVGIFIDGEFECYRSVISISGNILYASYNRYTIIINRGVYII